MKKHKSNNRKQKRKTNHAAGQPASTGAGRRDFLRRARNGAIALAVVGGAGFFFVQTVRSSIHEQDLSRIGNGTPTIVQIHDPQCSSCAALQRATRSALRAFDEDELDYVVANIRSTEGSEFAARHSVPHVTLLLFDGAGERKLTLQGQRRSEELERAFRSLLGN